jgi:hypothetical protein
LEAEKRSKIGKRQKEYGINVLDVIMRENTLKYLYRDK